MVISIVLGVALLLAVLGFVLSAFKARAERQRFSAIVDVDAEVTRLRATATSEVALLRVAAADDAVRIKTEAQRYRDEAILAKSEAANEAERIKRAATSEADAARRTSHDERERHASLVQDSQHVMAQLEQLGGELRKVEGNLEDISFGLYRPHYHFDTPEQFKAKMETVFGQQKEMIRAGKAANFAVSWTVGDSKKDGERMQKQYTKLILRAFNGECDASIAKVNWNNATKMEERIRKAFDAINQLGEVMTVSLSAKYRDLKLAELRLEHELAEKKRAIADEQRRIREQMRDEEKALQEAERAQAEAHAEELRFQKALEKAKVELGKARGEEHTRLSAKIQELVGQLSEAQAKSVRAKSLAEMTKAGYIYVISNIGSFGDRVFKIGMTRRLEPMDRVRELGGASVPFPFDVHAMVYSENAPGLEAAFHQRFRDRSVNLINQRKEFFNVEIAELERFAIERGLAMTFTKLAEAREYRESAAMRLAKGSGPTAVPTTAAGQLALASTVSKHPARSASTEGRREDVPVPPAELSIR